MPGPTEIMKLVATGKGEVRDANGRLLADDEGNRYNYENSEEG
jgi:hypothetical protein